MTHNPYERMARKPLTPKQKLKMFVENDGVCCVCGGKIDGIREAWDELSLEEFKALKVIDEHVNPLWRNGTNEPVNRKPAHERCARIKTSEEATQRAKIEEVAERHFGAKRGTMPGSRGSKFKKLMSGKVVPR